MVIPCSHRRIQAYRNRRRLAGRMKIRRRPRRDRSESPSRRRAHVCRRLMHGAPSGQIPGAPGVTTVMARLGGTPLRLPVFPGTSRRLSLSAPHPSANPAASSVRRSRKAVYYHGKNRLWPSTSVLRVGEGQGDLPPLGRANCAALVDLVLTGRDPGPRNRKRRCCRRRPARLTISAEDLIDRSTMSCRRKFTWRRLSMVNMHMVWARVAAPFSGPARHSTAESGFIPATRHRGTHLSYDPDNIWFGASGDLRRRDKRWQGRVLWA